MIRSRISRRSRCSRSCRTYWWSIPALPAKDVQDLIALARKAPGTLKYASGGVGSTSHFAVAMFVSAAGISKQTLHLPYKGGAASMIATMSNETQFYLGPIPGMVPQIQAGKVRAIAITGDKRSSSLPDVPTLAEIGLAGAESSGWFGPLAPAGTPPAIIDQASPGGRRHQQGSRRVEGACGARGRAADQHARGIRPLHCGHAGAIPQGGERREFEVPVRACPSAFER